MSTDPYDPAFATLSVLWTVLLLACSFPATEDVSQLSSASERVPGEYIVTVERNEAESLLRHLFKAYGIEHVKDLGAGNYLLKLKNDPGIAELRRIEGASEKVRSIQPNLVYRH